jgi:hypothetical protein
MNEVLLLSIAAVAGFFVAVALTFVVYRWASARDSGYDEQTEAFAALVTIGHAAKALKSDAITLEDYVAIVDSFVDVPGVREMLDIAMSTEEEE